MIRLVAPGMRAIFYWHPPSNPIYFTLALSKVSWAVCALDHMPVDAVLGSFSQGEETVGAYFHLKQVR